MSGFNDISTSSYQNSKNEWRRMVYLNLSEDEFLEFKTLIDSRNGVKPKPEPEPEPSIEMLQHQLQTLQNRKNSIGLRASYMASIRAMEKQIETKEAEFKEIEERENYPHVFGAVSDMCYFCAADRGLFGRNEGKPCHNRYIEEKDKKKKENEPVPIVIVLREKNHVRHIYFRTPEGKLLNPGKYVGKIVEVQVEKVDEN